jgi:hypothetical protein
VSRTFAACKIVIFKQRIAHVHVCMKIVLKTCRCICSLRNTIWLDPLVVKEHLKEINVTTNTFNVRLDLLKEVLAVPNEEVQFIDSFKNH